MINSDNAVALPCTRAPPDPSFFVEGIRPSRHPMLTLVVDLQTSSMLVIYEIVMGKLCPQESLYSQDSDLSELGKVWFRGPLSTITEKAVIAMTSIHVCLSIFHFVGDGGTREVRMLYEMKMKMIRGRRVYFPQIENSSFLWFSGRVKDLTHISEFR